MEKQSDLILLDLFSGVGGFHKGLLEAGFNFSETYFSEIDKHAIANYKYNNPNAKHIGSVENILQSGITRPNIITFGSPCQDFSLAGKRAGLDGARSGLITQAIAAISHFKPDLFIWENVKGAFSSNNREDFWAIIQAFANIGGYRFEWQLVNTSWLLPQNRERIYLVGHLATSFRNWRSVFPISEKSFNTNGIKKGSSPNQTVGTIMACYGKTPTDGQYVEVIQVNPSKESQGKQPSQHNRVYSDKGVMATLDTDTRKNVFLSEPLHKHGEERIFKDTAPTIQARYGTGGDNVPYVNYPSVHATYKHTFEGFKGYLDKSPTIKAGGGSGNDIVINSIRHLTEIECERLQGFPDNWTQYGNYDDVIKAIPKTQRYKLIGNAVTATMVTLIGQRLFVNFRPACAMALSPSTNPMDDSNIAA